MQLIARAALEHSAPEDADAAALRQSNSPTLFEPKQGHLLKWPKVRVRVSVRVLTLSLP